jgi:hypothetical protein
VLAEARRRNAALGHENLGALSESHGFLAQRPPEHDLPAPHEACVAAVGELPDLCRTLRVRRRLEALPELDASVEALDGRHLLRAASVLGLAKGAQAADAAYLNAAKTLVASGVRAFELHEADVLIRGARRCSTRYADCPR